MNKKNTSGQTIIEVLIALSTAVVIISATTLAVLTAINNASYTQTQNSATRYAQEGLEFMKFLRNSNYKVFNQLSKNTIYCLDKGATSVYAATTNSCGNLTCGDNVDNFSRTIEIVPNSNYCAPVASGGLTPPPNTTYEVSVTVSWTDSKCLNACPCHQSQLISCVSDYNVISAPTDPTAVPTPTP